MRPPTAVVLAAVFAFALHPSPAPADSVGLLPSADTALMESSPEDDYNFGAQRKAPIGATGIPNGGARARGLFRFDIAGGVPAGSTIDSARFRLTVETTPPGNQPSDFTLHRMLVPWIEGTKGTPEKPGGRPATAGEPTWNHRAVPATTWGATDTPGGEEGSDYSATVSATERMLSAERTYEWDLNSTGIADVQDMLDNPAANHGWMLKSDAESTPKTARRFFMKETLTDRPDRVGPPPELTIEFTPPPNLEPPEVTQFSFDGEDITIEFAAEAGLSYAIEVSENLAEGQWVAIQNFDPVVDGPIATTIPGGASIRKIVRVTASLGD